MDGHEVARRLLSIPDRRCIPIIAGNLIRDGGRSSESAGGWLQRLYREADRSGTFVAQVERIVREKSSGSCAE